MSFIRYLNIKRPNRANVVEIAVFGDGKNRASVRVCGLAILPNWRYVSENCHSDQLKLI